jgi:hypothetical protein
MATERKRERPENEGDCAETKRQRKSDDAQEKEKADTIEALFEDVMMLYSECVGRYSGKKQIYYAFVSRSAHDEQISEYMTRETSFPEIDGKHSEPLRDVETTRDPIHMLKIMLDKDSKCSPWAEFYVEERGELDFEKCDDELMVHFDDKGVARFPESIGTKMRNIAKRMYDAEVLMETKETLYIDGEPVREFGTTERLFEMESYTLL